MVEKPKYDRQGGNRVDIIGILSFSRPLLGGRRKKSRVTRGLLSMRRKRLPIGVRSS